MKLFSRLRMPAALAIALFFIGAKADAQGFGLGVTNSAGSNSAGSILVSNSLTYSISVTNQVGDLVTTALISNALPASVQFLHANSSQGSFTNYGSVIVFDLGAFGALQVAQLSLTVRPTALGFITNAISVATTNLALNSVSTNIVTQVTNSVLPQADLGVTLTGFAQQTNIVNDLMTYGVAVTNLGLSAAPNVVLTNTLPPGVILKSVSPANQPYSVVTSNLIFNLSTLEVAGGTNLQFTVQPTNAGVLNFFASIGSSGVVDPNPTNNAASTNIFVITSLPGQLTVGLVSTQRYNPQNGLVEQVILLSNIGTNDVPAARVVVTGLTNRLFNASGTNSGNPFVVYVSTLGTNQSVNLLLQFLAANYFTMTNSQLSAFGVPVPDLSPPPASSTGTNLNISRIIQLADGNVLIEFPSVASRVYTVVYSDNVLFSNAAIAPPSIVATANRLQWIDYGPPATVSAPTNSTNRFYRVFQNP